MKKLTNLIPNFMVKRCPKTGRIVKLRFDNVYAKIAFPLMGLLAIIWFLVRVVPKPSRVAYPCQQVAIGIGGTFLLYVIGLITSLGVYTQISKRLNKSLALGFIVLVAIITSVTVGVAITSNTAVATITTPPEPRNTPMGVAKGIFPGRVAWAQDFDATSWVEGKGNYWEDAYTNQKNVTRMLSASLRGFTNGVSDKDAWDKLFKYNNKLKGLGEKGYTRGEKIVIKLNLNPVRTAADNWGDKGYPSPQMVYALIAQLIDVCGVAGKDIILSEPSRFIGPQIVNKIRANPSLEYQAVIIEVNNAAGLKGYQSAVPDLTKLIYVNMPNKSLLKMCFPKSFTEASYIINYSLVRPHRVFAVTSVAKNHFGSVYSIAKKEFTPTELHAFALWDYTTPNKMNDPHCSPVLLGHDVTAKKTFLYLAEGLYVGLNQGGAVQRFTTFNNDWFSSLLISQDPVALESVVADFISNEPNLTTSNPSFNGNQDNQFHECALANNPPSGTKYDPENDGTVLQSLGVHEHWNNATKKQYTRNLGTGNGIELYKVSLLTSTNKILNEKSVVYPNPFSDHISFNSRSGTYRIVTLSGKLIQSGQTTLGTNTLSLPSLKAGTYLINFSSAEGDKIVKIQKR